MSPAGQPPEVDAPPPGPSRVANDKWAFLRQSGWMIIATVAGGVFMSAVHVVVNKPMTTSEYAVFFALLRVFLLMGFPAGGLQVVFAQQAAAAMTVHEQRQLSQTIRAVLRATFVIWLIMALGVFLGQTQLLRALKIVNPAALWITVLLGLASLWAPVFKGVLQGRQNFAGLGWVIILDGIGRFTAIVVIVHFGGQAAGAMAGALVGQGVSLALGTWLTRTVLAGRGDSFAWRPWLRRVIPLTLGVGVFLFVSNADVIFVQAVFGKDESPFYTPAAMIGLALITFTTPLAAVMFPKVVQSAARTKSTDAVQHALIATALLGGTAALACTLFPALPLRIIYFRNPIYWRSAELIPWFAWCLLPLILANVLISNLLARGRFRIVPWLVAVALGYGLALSLLQSRLLPFVQHDLRNPLVLVERVRTQADPSAKWLWQHLTPDDRNQFMRQYTRAEDVRPWLLPALNELLKGPSLYDPESFAHVSLSDPTEKLLEAHATGQDLVRLNRLLLQQVFPAELISPEAKMFEGFKTVIGTLGLFSSTMLALVLWFSFRQPFPSGRGPDLPRVE